MKKRTKRPTNDERRLLASAPRWLTFAASDDAVVFAETEVRAADGAEPTQKLKSFKGTAYTGAAMKVAGFFRPVVVDLAGLKADRDSVPFYLSHDPGQIVGHGAVTIGANKVSAEGLISGVGDAATTVAQSALNGFPWQMSLGADVHEFESLREGESTTVNGKTVKGPVLVARKATLVEVSFVPRGADVRTSAKVAATAMGDPEMTTFEDWLAAQGFDPETLTEQQKAPLKAAYDAEHKTQEPPAADSTTAAQTVVASATTGAPATPSEHVAQLRAEAAAEFKRQREIQEVAKDHPDIAAKAIEAGWTIAETKAALLDKIRASRPTAPAIHVRSHEVDCNLQALQAAMILRFGGRLDAPAYRERGAVALKLPEWVRAGINDQTRQRAMEWGHRYSDLSAIDLCREALRLDGREAPLSRSELIQAAFSGSALANIFTTSVNARLLATYAEAGDTTQGWTQTTEVADFKTNERPRMAKGPNLAKLPRGGEADHYDRSDLVEKYKIARYAKKFVVDEQDFIDDSLGAIESTPVEMGLAAARLRPDLVYAILLKNAALDADAKALFHADHKNLNATAALGSAKLQAAIAALEKQQENGVNLNLRATHLIVPSDLKHTGAELINSSQIMVATGSDTTLTRGTMNTIAAIESLALVSDARLSNGVTDPVDGVVHSGSTSTWFLASAMAHTIEVAYRRGTGQSPEVRSFILTQGKWGMGWDINLDIGAKALDFRGLQKNTA